MPGQLALIPAGSRKVGPLERSLMSTMRQWQTREHLTGPANAARRATLRELARLADEAIVATDTEGRSQYATAQVIRAYREALDEYSPPPEHPIDPRAAQVSEAALAVLTALDQP